MGAPFPELNGSFPPRAYRTGPAVSKRAMTYLEEGFRNHASHSSQK